VPPTVVCSNDRLKWEFAILHGRGEWRKVELADRAGSPATLYCRNRCELLFGVVVRQPLEKLLDETLAHVVQAVAWTTGPLLANVKTAMPARSAWEDVETNRPTR
jgi:hypothetical protein